MANKKVSQLVSKPSVLVTDLFPIADPTTGQLFKTTISALGTAIGSGVSSVNTLVGAVVLDTDDIQELASPTNRWYTDTRARAAISGGTGISYNSGTGVITNAVTSGQIATALGYTPADDALVVKLAGSQTITGTKTFQQAPLVDIGVGFKNSNGVYNTMQSLVTGWQMPVNGNNHNLIFSTTTNYVYTFPNASGTIALTSNLGAYLPLAGGTMTGAIVGTTATFTNAGSGIGLGVTLSNASGDGIKITHSAGRAFNIQSSGSGFGVLINNETASTSSPFTIQKQGATVISMTDTGAIAGTSIELTNGSAANALRITHTNTSYHAVSITATGGSALYATGSVTVIGTLNATGVVTASSGLSNGAGQSFALPSSTGTLALTSQLSSYLPLSGGTLTGELNASGIKIDGDPLPYIMSTLAGADLNIQFPVGQKLSINDNGATNVAYFGKTEHRLLINGAIAMTVNSGGTSLNSALVGTSANFSSNVTGLKYIANSQATYASMTYEETIKYASSPAGIWFGNSFNSNNNVALQLRTSNDGTSVQALTLASTGAATFSSSVTVVGNGRNVTINGGVDIKGDSGGWATQHGFSGSGGADLGGFGANGSGNSLTSYYIGTQGTPRIFINSAGNVGIGTTAPLSITNFTTLEVKGTSSGLIGVSSSAGAAYGRMYNDGSKLIVGTSTNNILVFDTNDTERMRITSDGYLKSSNTGSYYSATGLFSEFCNNNASLPALYLSQTSTSFTDNVLFAEGYTNTSNNTWYLISGYNRAQAAYKFRVADSGNVTNTNNSYGAISDIKLKENISDATSKLSDLLKIKIKNFNYIGSDEKQLGVIAQDVEEVFPGLVEIHTDRDGDGKDLGTVTKSVKYSVFVPMLIKAVQELSDKITTLENK
jgi:hypothetical protein